MLAFQSIISKYEILRTIFRLVGGEPRQFVIPAERSSFSLGRKTVSDLGAAIGECIAIEEMHRFDLATGPLLRVTLLRSETGEHALVTNLHHIVSDQWSNELLLKECLSTYEMLMQGEFQETPLRIQYKDYSCWQNKTASDPDFSVHRDYWLGRFGREIPVLDIHTDYARPSKGTFEGKTVQFKLNRATFSKLKHIGSREDASTFMTLVSVINIVLYRLTGQQDVILGSGLSRPDRA
ncbi:MAG: condensation domain-containing protein, partial [Flammeovirgaceae bacterium]